MILYYIGRCCLAPTTVPWANMGVDTLSEKVLIICGAPSQS
jgi:hypothetical protein